MTQAKRVVSARFFTLAHSELDVKLDHVATADEARPAGRGGSFDGLRGGNGRCSDIAPVA